MQRFVTPGEFHCLGRRNVSQPWHPCHHDPPQTIRRRYLSVEVTIALSCSGHHRFKPAPASSWTCQLTHLSNESASQVHRGIVRRFGIRSYAPPFKKANTDHGQFEHFSRESRLPPAFFYDIASLSFGPKEKQDGVSEPALSQAQSDTNQKSWTIRANLSLEEVSVEEHSAGDLANPGLGANHDDPSINDSQQSKIAAAANPHKPAERISPATRPRRTQLPFERLWHKASRRKKLDLSTYSVLQNERRESVVQVKEARSPHNDFHIFRENTGFRKRLGLFMKNYYHQLFENGTVKDNVLSRLISDLDQSERWSTPARLSRMLNSSWILMSEPGMAIRRLISLSSSSDAHHKNSTDELMIVLQILRSPHIDAISLFTLTHHCLATAQEWPCSGDVPMLLTVRLMRHARRVAPDQFPLVAELAVKLLDLHSRTSKRVNEHVLSFRVNRLMSLLALPASKTPFAATHAQQCAQLILLEYIESNQQILLGREGYRALAQLQLQSKRTQEERQWAQNQVKSWPPWQPKDRMGGDLGLVSPFLNSRLSRVLDRMQNQGYALGEMEAGMKILAGVDTDGSPTTQVRRSAELFNMPVGSKTLQSRHGSDSYYVWLARIEATRTVREAWMCFCAYKRNQRGGKMHVAVYHAMFRKLFAQMKPSEQRGPVLPGDGREVAPDPESPRQLVYIPEKIPTIDGLVQQMHQTNTLIPARLLADLLDRVRDFQQGFKYIKGAAISKDVRDVLLNPKRYGVVGLATNLLKVPQVLQRAYIGMLARLKSRQQNERYWFHIAVHDNPDRYELGVHNPQHFAKALLIEMKTTSVHTWNVFLEAVCQSATRIPTEPSKLGLSVSPSSPPGASLRLPSCWSLVCDVVEHMYNKQIAPDFYTFGYLASVGLNLQSWDKYEPANRPDPHFVLKQLFLRAALGSSLTSEKMWFCGSTRHQTLANAPSSDHIEIMLWSLAAQQTRTSIYDTLALLEWLNVNFDHIFSEERTLKREVGCAFRCTLEAAWADEDVWNAGLIPLASETQLRIAQAVCTKFAWPSDVEMDWYLNVKRSLVKRLNNKSRYSMTGNGSAKKIDVT